MPRRRRRTVLRYRRVRRRRRPIQWKLSEHVSREIFGIFFLGFGVLNFLAIQNNAGSFGVFWNTNFLTPLFGIGSYIAPIICLIIGLSLLLTDKVQYAAGRVVGVAALILSSLGLIQLSAPMDTFFESSKEFGGYIGFSVDFLFFLLFGETATAIMMSILAITSLLLIFNISFRELFGFFRESATPEKTVRVKPEKMSIPEALLTPLARGLKEKREDLELNIIRGDEQEKKLAGISAKPAKPATQKSDNKPLIGEQQKVDYSQYKIPPLDVLSTDPENPIHDDDQLVEHAEIIRRKLEQFTIPVTMKDAHVGPTVIQYTLKPAEDVKLSKITTLKNDLCLALSAQAIRIEAPIPGKGLVGIEVPSRERSIVHLGSILRLSTFQSTGGDLKFVLGRDVSGHPVFSDLTKMPHLLIAGQTGSGKSIGINAILISFLFQHSPETLRMIMIDPKRVELTNYNGIPHLLTPVITEPDKALQALKWAVSEMNRRYKELARLGKRNIDEYNRSQPETVMPFVVIVIDELADLMMAASREIEATICRIAQLARATGIHLVIATQRPSVDVITGLIKANIPTRIAFTVTTGIDSRTIIDAIGAEDLIGQGDMLYLPSDLAKPIRLQGAFVSTKEIEKVIHFIKLNSPTGVKYDDEVTADHSDVPVPGLATFKLGEDGETSDNDLERAIQAIREGKKASASYLQRRLSFGYAKAARILDQLEEMGMIGPSNGAKPRAIFITEETEVPMSNETKTAETLNNT